MLFFDIQRVFWDLNLLPSVHKIHQSVFENCFCQEDFLLKVAAHQNNIEMQLSVDLTELEVLSKKSLWELLNL